MEPRPADRGPGRIIFLNGLVDSGMLPARRDPVGPFAWWEEMRPRFFDGFHRCLPALAAAGNDVIVEHIIEFRPWRAELARLLEDLDVFLVGVHCDLAEIDRRERERGNRRIGEGRTHVEIDLIHDFGPYDFNVDTIEGISIAPPEPPSHTPVCSAMACSSSAASSEASAPPAAKIVLTQMIRLRTV